MAPSKNWKVPGLMAHLFRQSVVYDRGEIRSSESLVQNRFADIQCLIGRIDINGISRHEHDLQFGVQTSGPGNHLAKR